MMLEDGAGIDNEPGGSFTFLGNSHPSGGAYIYSDSSPTFFTNEGSSILRRNRERPDIHPNRILYRDEHGVDSTERRLPRVRRKCHVQRLDHCRHWHDAHVRRSVDEVHSSSSLTSTGFVVLENTTTVAGAYDVAGTTLANSSSGITFTAPITDLVATWKSQMQRSTSRPTSRLASPTWTSARAGSAVAAET